MVECEFCNQEMNEAESCTKNAILYPGGIDHPEVHGVYALAVAYGEESDWDADERCHDCGIKPGGHHHPGCDVEESPVRGTQLLREVLENRAGFAPMHAYVTPDPHEQISMEDVVQANKNRGEESA